jgi:hypothetical protein
MSRRSVATIVGVAAGAALLVWQIRATGMDRIASGFTAVGWQGAIGILILSLLRFAARSTGWTALIATDTPPGRALAAVIIGEAAGSLTPLSLVVSEPLKAAYLGAAVPGLGTAGALAALAAETFFFGVSIAIYVLAGAAMLIFVYPVDATVRVAGIASIALMATALLIALWMSLRKPTIVGSTISRIPLPLARVVGEHVRAFERTAYASTTHPGARVGIVCAAVASFHILSFLELWLTLWLITGKSLIAAAFILDTVGRLVNVMFKVIPLQLGVLQVGSEVVARVLGLAPGVGVTVSLVRTVRILFWCVIGIALWGRGRRVAAG